MGLRITEDEGKLEWAQAAHGAYLLRTNCRETDPGQLWRWYIQLTEVEDAFRISQSDLGMRPVYHQREDRIQAHIVICFLALALWRSFETHPGQFFEDQSHIFRPLRKIRKNDGITLTTRIRGYIRLIKKRPQRRCRDALTARWAVEP